MARRKRRYTSCSVVRFKGRRMRICRNRKGQIKSMTKVGKRR